MVSLQDVRAAAERIGTYVVRTPMERSAELSALCGVDVWLKLECFQKTGSFKLRGALNALMLLPEDGRRRGVITASAGNHGLGVARAAAVLGIRAVVVVPETAADVKVQALRQSGADLLLRGATYDDAEAAGLELARAQGRPFISAYNDPAVVAGAGTIALEILEDLPDVRTLLVPAGGGGLISGVGVAAHAVEPAIMILGAQSVASPALAEALAVGRLVTVEVQPSLADGLAGNVEQGSITLDLVKEHVQQVVLLAEDEIAQAMRWLLEHERVVVEGSAAVGVAALLSRRPAMGGPVAVVLSGRNVSASVLRHDVLGLS